MQARFAGPFQVRIQACATGGTRVRGRFLNFLFLLCVLGSMSLNTPGVESTPIILNTDIGSDIDDTWALALILASPELDLQLVVTDSFDTVARAKIAAKFLHQVGRPDIPVAIGTRSKGPPGAQFAWAEHYELSEYPGTVYENGVEALVDFIMKSEREITLLVVGPAPNIQEALRREPRIAQRARVIAMSGSIDRGYGGKNQPDPEYNVKSHPASTAAMYAADWEVLVAPLDTAGLIRVEGPGYQQILHSEDPVSRTLMENYRVWARNISYGPFQPREASSTLYDCVVVYLALRPESCEIDVLNVRVTDEGYTVREPSGSRILAALRWRDLSGFQDFLVRRLGR